MFRRVSNLLLWVVIAIFTANANRNLNVAVIGFESHGAVSSDEVKMITERFEAELIKNNFFSVVERSQMDKILQEQGFQNSGACDTDTCKVEVGQLLGVDRLITGSIGKVGELFTLTVKEVDVETGAIYSSYSADFTDGIENVLLRGCREVAGALVAKNRDTYRQPKDTLEGVVNDQDTGTSFGVWIAGGAIVVGAVVLYLILNADEDAGENKQICLGEC